MKMSVTVGELRQAIAETVENQINQNVLKESHKKDARILLLDKEEPVDFGSVEHVGDLKKALAILTALRDAYKPGSGHRMIFASAVRCIKNLIERFETKVATKTE
jgi:hypothetical protein